METQHTPGPWRLETTVNETRSSGSYDYFWYEIFAKGRKTALAEVFELDADERDGVWDPETRANAHLMAAAPDMFEALKQAATQFRAYEQQHLAKGTPEADEKARTNARYAELCEAALPALTPA